MPFFSDPLSMTPYFFNTPSQLSSDLSPGINNVHSLIGTSEGVKNVNFPRLLKEDAETLVDMTKDAFKEIASVVARLDNTSEEHFMITVVFYN